MLQTLRRFLKSFIFAKKGIAYVFRNERNFRVDICIAVIILIIGCILGWSALKWSIVILASAMVLTLEMVNSAIEYSWNHLEPNHHPVVGTIKDVMAGAVLVASCAAAGVGLLVVFGHF